MFKVGNVIVTDRDPKIECVIEEIEPDEDQVTYITRVLSGDRYDSRGKVVTFVHKYNSSNRLIDERGREVIGTVIAKMDISFTGYRKVLTEEQKERYLEKEGKECPFCQHELDHEFEDLEISGDDEVYQTIACPHCNSQWREFSEIEPKMSYIVDA